MARGRAGLRPYQLDGKGRVSLSPEARELLGVGPGDYVTYEVDGKAVRVRKVKISVE